MPASSRLQRSTRLGPCSRHHIEVWMEQPCQQMTKLSKRLAQRLLIAVQDKSRGVRWGPRGTLGQWHGTGLSFPTVSHSPVHWSGLAIKQGLAQFNQWGKIKAFPRNLEHKICISANCLSSILPRLFSLTLHSWQVCLSNWCVVFPSSPEEIIDHQMFSVCQLFLH